MTDGLRFALRWTRYTVEVGVTLGLLTIAWIVFDQDRGKNRHA